MLRRCRDVRRDRTGRREREGERDRRRGERRVDRLRPQAACRWLLCLPRPRCGLGTGRGRGCGASCAGPGPGPHGVPLVPGQALPQVSSSSPVAGAPAATTACCGCGCHHEPGDEPVSDQEGALDHACSSLVPAGQAPADGDDAAGGCGGKPGAVAVFFCGGGGGMFTRR